MGYNFYGLRQKEIFLLKLQESNGLTRTNGINEHWSEFLGLSRIYKIK